MDTLIQQAAKGNRAAMNQLYESNKARIYLISYSLLRGSNASVDAAKWALISALQAVFRDSIQTEENFTAYAVQQAANYCKKEISKKDSHAFKLPPKKNFHISAVSESTIAPVNNTIEYYFNALPACQRFVLVLRLPGGMRESQISKVIGMNTSAIHSIIDVEPDNLDKIYSSIKAQNKNCALPAKEELNSAFEDALAQISVPNILDEKVYAYIDSVAAPLEASAKNKQKKLFAFIAAAALVCMMILFSVLSGLSQKDSDTDTNANAANISTDDSTENESDSQNSVNETEAAETSSTANGDTTISKGLDTALTYYADIEIEDYGTITVQLDQEAAPVTVENFITLAENGFYDGLTFHRIIEGFMMQGGDPNGNGTGGSGETIVGEFSDNGYANTLSHTRGAISMARSSEYDSASSQFFIVHEDCSDSLDGQYAVFGYVIEGMEIVDTICETAEPTDNNGSIESSAQPVITSITIWTEAAE